MDDAARPRSENDKTSAGVTQAAEETINLADYFRVIAKHRRMIFRICAITVVITAVVSLFLPKTYSATASVMPPVDVFRGDLASTGLGALKSSLLQKAIDVSSVANMYVGILRSRSVADALVERFNLGKIYQVKNSVGIRQILRENTRINVTDDGIIDITVEDRDPCMAAVLANAYVEELDRQNKRLFVGQVSSKKVFLENRLREIELELSQIDNLLSRDAKIKEMLFELLTREYEIAKIEEAKSMPTIQVLDKAIVPEGKSKPRRMRLVFFACMGGLFVSVFMAFVRENVVHVSS